MDDRNKWLRRAKTIMQHISPKLSQVHSKIQHINKPNISSSKKLSTLAQQRLQRKDSDVLTQFSPLVSGKIKKSLVTYLSPHQAYTAETLQAGVLLVAHTRAEVRRQFINRLCKAAIERSALVYSVTPQGSVGVTTPGVYRLTTHPTLSRRAILNALLRHGAHLLIFGTINTRDDMMSLMDAVYTGYHCVAEIYGESAHDVLSRLEAVGVDTSILPQNLRIVVPAEESLVE